MPNPFPPQRRSFPTADFAALPFVADLRVGPRRIRRSFWSVPPCENYPQAVASGGQYAADYAQFLKQHADFGGSGLLARIALDMGQYRVGDEMHGYAVGFMAFIERLVFFAATHCDHYALAADCVQREAALIAAYEASRSLKPKNLS